MKKLITVSLLNFLVLTALITPLRAQQSYVYDFRNVFTEVSGTGPTLNVLGTGSFVNEGLMELSCVARPVYGFTQNSGVQFDNSSNFIGTGYSVEMYFQFLSNTGFKRIIDFKNQTTDSGLYCTGTELQFYDAITVTTSAFLANQYAHLVLTRDAATELVSLYVDGALIGTFTDNTGLALLNSSNVMNFFQDDLIFGGEARPGRIALLALYDYTLDSAQVADNFNNLQVTSNALSYSVDNTAACLIGNDFNFTNTSNNAGGYSYTWDFGDTGTATGNNVSHTYTQSGTFTVLMIANNGSGCIDTVSSDVVVYDAAPVDLGPDVSICDGNNVILDAGAGFVTYLWDNGSALQTFTTSTAGTYSVTVTDSTGCIGTDTIVVDVVQYPLLDLGPDLNLCFGESATLSATSGMNSYDWSTGDTTETIQVNASGVYAVEIANAAGCSVSDTVLVTVNPEILVSLGADTTFCEGNTLTLNPGSGFQALLWSDNSTDPTLDVTTSGTYSVVVTDLFSCTASDTIEVVVNALPIVNLGNDTTFCGGNPVLLDAGAAFVGYMWSDGSQNPTLSVTAGGTYWVDVTDINGCMGTDTIVLDATPVISLGPDQVLCQGLTTTLDAGPGLASYLWNDGTTNQTLDVTSSGTYTVTVTDNSGCINQDVVEVNFNSVPVIDLGPDFDICDGQIGILDPGPGFQSYLWNDGTTSQVLFVTVAGTYTVTVSSATNCSAVDFITIGVLPAPALELGADTALCDGTTLTLDAGAGFNDYLWFDGTTSQTLDVTVTGIYGVTITGANGCEATDSLLVTFEGPPFLELGPDLSICDGTATVLDAGSGMASYLWSDGTTSQMLLVFDDGTYSVTITSLAGCQSQDSITISVVTPPVVSLGADTTICDGSQLVLDGGAGFSGYLWDDGSTSQTFTVTTAGMYTITVTDNNGCNGTDDIEVLYYAPVPVPVITQNVNTLSSSSPTGNQWYSVPGGIIPGATGQTFSPGADGTYYVIVTDANGCQSAPSADFVFVLDGISQAGGITLSMVPNPAVNSITITTSGLNSNSFDLEMTDLAGKVIMSQKAIPSGKFSVDISAFAEGIYIVKATSGSQQYLGRLVIAR